MKNVLILIFLIVTTSSFAWVSLDRDHASILTEADWQYMEEDNQKPAITIPETGEEYYNKWHCFSSSDIELLFVEIYYDKEKLSPTITTSNDGKYIEFAIDPDRDWDENKVMEYWKSLQRESPSICIFAVYLQETPNGELHYIERIKTLHATWDRNDETFLTY